MLFRSVQVDNPSGVYTITVTHKNSISNGPQKFSLIVSSGNNITLSNNEFSADNSQIMVYPNPANSVLNIGTKSLLNLQEVTINDIAGKEVYRRLNSLSSESIDVSSLASGVYFVTFKSDNGVTTKKFIKE